MSLFSPDERAAAEAISAITFCNPFLPERIEHERRALGSSFVESGLVWNAAHVTPQGRPNVGALRELVEVLCRTVRERLAKGARPRREEALLYEDVAMYALYYRQLEALDRLVQAGRAGRSAGELRSLHEGFVRNLHELLDHRALNLPPQDPAHLLACFFQIRRAFDQIFHSIVGRSLASAILRAAVWQSIFTHDMRRYRRSLFDKTSDFTTLIVGPSGTGKELVARAIAVSRYIPFDAKKKSFTEPFGGSFFPLNLSALSPTLIESELFGHRRGAFTGAIEDRSGWLQTCPPLGSVFLDEIGELDPAIQVKLLRLLQTRTFERLGDTRTLQFKGKIIAATNRDLGERMRRGAFRTDFYYRLCADIITTPSLREQLDGSADELRTLVGHIARRLLPDEADALTAEVMKNIRKNLGDDYAWPGNFRELEQCVNNVLIRGEYKPAASAARESGSDVIDAFRAGTSTADDLLSEYCAHVYAQSGTYESAAKVLKLDRRTVRAKVAQHHARGAGVSPASH